MILSSRGADLSKHAALLGIIAHTLVFCSSFWHVNNPSAFLTSGDAVQVLEFLAGKTVADL